MHASVPLILKVICQPTADHDAICATIKGQKLSRRIKRGTPASTSGLLNLYKYAIFLIITIMINFINSPHQNLKNNAN